MQHNSPTTNRPARIPPIIWVLGLGLIIALAAIFVFNVPLGTVGYYALFAFFIGSHFFMHGAHGGHGPRTMNANGPAGAAQSDKDQDSGHSGGCH